MFLFLCPGIPADQFIKPVHRKDPKSQRGLSKSPGLLDKGAEDPSAEPGCIPPDRTDQGCIQHQTGEAVRIPDSIVDQGKGSGTVSKSDEGCGKFSSKHR